MGTDIHEDLGPVDEAIRQGNCTTALELIDPLSKKYSSGTGSIRVQVLKALCLLKLRRPSGILEVCKQVEKQICSIETARDVNECLQAISVFWEVCFRLGKLELADIAWKHLYNLSQDIPMIRLDDIELGLTIFLCLFTWCCYSSDFAKQVEIANENYTRCRSTKFVLASVCSTQVQSRFGRNVHPKQLVLAEVKLAQHLRSLKKENNKLCSEEAIEYMSVLELRGDYTKALKLFDKSLRQYIESEDERLRIEGRIRARSQDFAGAAELFMKLLHSCPDDWECVLDCLSCLLEDGSRWCSGTNNNQSPPSKSVGDKASDEMFERKISKALSFVDELQLLAGEKRIYWLAEVEIRKREYLYKNHEDTKLMKALVTYFLRFGGLPCFTSDVEMYIDVLDSHQKKTLVQNFMEICNSSCPQEELLLGITVLKLQASLCVSSDINIFSCGELHHRMVCMAKLYCATFRQTLVFDPKICICNQLEFEYVASEILVQLFWRTGENGYLLEALMVLEFVLSTRRSNKCMILLLQLYALFSAFTLSLECLRSTGVRSALEVISHHMLLAPFWVELTDLLEGNLDDTSELLVEATKNYATACMESSSKASALFKSKVMLQNSHLYLRVLVELPMLEMKKKANIEEVKCFLDSLNCGKDLLAITRGELFESMTFSVCHSPPWWTSNYLLGSFDGRQTSCHRLQESSHPTEKWHEEVRKLIERRSYLPRMVYLSIQYAEFLKENEEKGSSDNNNYLELLELLGRFASALGALDLPDAVTRVAESLNEEKSIEGELGPHVIDWISFAVFVNACELGKGYEQWRRVDNLIERYAEEKLRFLRLHGSSHEDLTVLVQMVTEPIAWHCLVIQSFFTESLLPSDGNESQKLLNESMLPSIESLLGTLEKIRNWVKIEINSADGRKSVEALLSLLRGTRGDISGPGEVINILKWNMSDLEVSDDSASEGLEHWSPEGSVRRVLASQKQTLAAFLNECNSKREILMELRRQLCPSSTSISTSLDIGIYL